MSDLLESAAVMMDIAKAREHVRGGLEALREKLAIPASNGKTSDGTVSLSTYSPPHKPKKGNEMCFELLPELVSNLILLIKKKYYSIM